MPALLPATIWGNHHLEWGQRTYIMGIVNVTPDSFSGDGLIEESLTEDALVQRAIALAHSFVAEGATFIDIGGESTRPGADPTPAHQELARVLPVLRALHAILPEEVILSIDTYKAEVADRAIEAGASLINDIWALRRDPAMTSVARHWKVPIVLMANMRNRQQKYDIVSDVIRFLAKSIDTALEAGIAWEHIIIDPGIGFGTTPEENLALLRRLGELRALGRPILLGTSRKSTIGLVLGGLPASERLEGTAATVALGIAQGADIVRVHDAREMTRVVKMSDAIVRGVFTLPKTST
jgi:dihydropteroate synthase